MPASLRIIALSIVAFGVGFVLGGRHNRSSEPIAPPPPPRKSTTIPENRSLTIARTPQESVHDLGVTILTEALRLDDGAFVPGEAETLTPGAQVPVQPVQDIVSQVPQARLVDARETLEQFCDAIVDSSAVVVALVKTRLCSPSGTVPGLILDGGIPDSAWELLAGYVLDELLWELLFPNAGPPDEMRVGDASQRLDEGQITAASATTELPDGVTLRARVRWNPVYHYSADNKLLPQTLEVLVDVGGEGAKQTMRQGMHWVDKAMTTDGSSLRAAEFTGISSEDPRTSCLRVERSGKFSHAADEHPKDGVRAVFEFEHPENSVTEIADFSGSLKLKIATQSRTVTIPNALSFIGREIEHPEFQKSRFRFMLVNDESEIRLKLIAGDVNLVGDIEPIDGKGNALSRFGFHSFLDFMHKIEWDSKDFPKDMGLRFTLYEGLSEVTVPFDFTNMTVPPLQERRNPGSLSVRVGRSPPSKP